MKIFRGKEVIGWRVIENEDRSVFEEEINDLMEKYNFEDFQFSVDKYGYYATILISNKEY